MESIKNLVFLFFLVFNFTNILALTPTTFEDEIELSYNPEMDKTFSLDLTSVLQKKIGTAENLIYQIKRLPVWLTFDGKIFIGIPIEDDLGNDYLQLIATTEKSNKNYLVDVILKVHNPKIPDMFLVRLLAEETSENNYSFSMYLPAHTKISGKHKTNKTLPSYLTLHEDGFVYGTIEVQELLHFKKFVLPIEVSPNKNFYIIIKP